MQDYWIHSAALSGREASLLLDAQGEAPISGNTAPFLMPQPQFWQQIRSKSRL